MDSNEQNHQDQSLNQQPVSPVRNYFSDDIMRGIASMSDREMVSILKELPSSQFWIAILKYNQQRLAVSQNALFVGDPHANPTAMARNQGILLGISDLQNAVISLISMSSDAEDEGNPPE